MNDTALVTMTLEEIEALHRAGKLPPVRDLPDAGDGEEYPEGFWDAAVWVGPEDLPKKLLSLRIDPDVIDWFRSQGPGYQTRMNAVLRRYMQAQKAKAAKAKAE